MASYTRNLNLKLPAYSDTADIKDMNDNFEKIDEFSGGGKVEEWLADIKNESDKVLLDIKTDSEQAVADIQRQATESMNAVNQKAKEALDSIPDSYEALESDVTSLKDTLDNEILGKPAAFSVDDLEYGSIANGTGENNSNWDGRIRTKTYLPVYAGAVIEDTTRQFNVWEYDSVTKAYICDNSSWTKYYTVQHDCVIRIMWDNATNPVDEIGDVLVNTHVEGARYVRFDVLPVDEIKTLISETDNRWNMIPSSTVKTISHRGRYGSGIGAMCCKSAVIAARKQGFQIVENDVNISSDGHFVMWHDPTLARIGDSEHSVSDYTLAELKAMDFGTPDGFPGEQILTFAEWVRCAKELGLDVYVDFKFTPTDAQARELVQTVRRYGMLKNASWLFNYDLIRKYDPSARLCITTVPTASNVETYAHYLDGGDVAYNPSSKLLDEENTMLALNAGYGLECWYVDYGTTSKAAVFAEIERVVNLGVQRMTIDVYRVDDVFAEKYGLIN